MLTRWTPDRQSGATGDYYAWIREGMALYEALRPLGIAVAEVFPTVLRVDRLLAAGLPSVPRPPLRRPARERFPRVRY